MAFVIAPEPPLEAWLEELDAQLARSPGFFEARPVIIDLVALKGPEPGAETLMAELEKRGMSVIDVENAGAVPGCDPWRRPLVGGRNGGEVDLAASEVKPPDPPAEETSLVVTDPVRSGQSIRFPKGDVTVIGSVASGAEVIAGGSVHIYGALRGRAMAGVLGMPNARVFCRQFEPELISIDGFYKTADQMDPTLRGRAVEARLAGESIVFAPLR